MPKDHYDRPYTQAEAEGEAHRCLQCVDAPCTEACPAGVDARNFIREIGTGNLRAASRFLRDQNVVSLACAYVCPTERLCEGACSNTKLNFPITIRRLQQYVSERDMEFPVRKGPDVDKRVAVIGAGPAGLAAAMRLVKEGIGVTVYEKKSTAGGMLANAIPPHRLPREAVKNEIEFVRRAGVEVLTNTPAPCVEDLLKDFDAVFIGAGLWDSARLPLPGFAEAAIPALGFLDSYVNRKDENSPPKLSGRVVVIGGGSVAMDTAGAAIRCGAEGIEMVCLEAPNEMPATDEDIRGMWEEGVIFKNRMMPTELVLENGRVTGVKAHSIRWLEGGLLVPSNAEKIEGTDVFIPAEHVIVAIGQRPEGSIKELIGDIQTEDGFIVVDDEMKTSRENVYAGGDIVNRGQTVVRAVQDGKKAADAIIAKLVGASS